MSIRIPNALQSPQLQLDLQRVKSQYSNYIAQISTGLQDVNLGDDPSASAEVLNFQSSINQNTQYMSQIDTATGYLQNTATVISSMGNAVTSLMSLAQQGMSGTQSATSQGAIAAQVDSTTQVLLNLGNTQVQGKYIFGGTDTTNPPFTAAAPVIAPPGVAQPNSYTYNGNNQTINLNVGQSSSTATNVPGDTLFLGGAAPGSYGSNLDLFNATNSLSAALKAGNTAGIETAYNNLKTINDHLNDVLTQVGGWTSGIASQKANLTSLNANLTTVQSGIASVNYPEAIAGLQATGNSQQATISAMNKITGQTNLFDLMA